MLIKTKINFKLFVPLSLIPTALCFLFTDNKFQMIGILVVYIATLLNLACLTEGILELIESQKELGTIKPKKAKIVYLFIGKFIVLILGLLIGVQMMGNKIIIPLLNYVVQIFTLSISLKSGDKNR